MTFIYLFVNDKKKNEANSEASQNIFFFQYLSIKQ